MKAEEIDEISYADGKVKVNVVSAGTYTVVLANYSGSQISAVKVITTELAKGENEITDLGGFASSAGGKIFLWKSLDTLKPVCAEYVVRA